MLPKAWNMSYLSLIKEENTSLIYLSIFILIDINTKQKSWVSFNIKIFRWLGNGTGWQSYHKSQIVFFIFESFAVCQLIPSFLFSHFLHSAFLRSCLFDLRPQTQETDHRNLADWNNHKSSIWVEMSWTEQTPGKFLNFSLANPPLGECSGKTKCS